MARGRGKLAALVLAAGVVVASLLLAGCGEAGGEDGGGLEGGVRSDSAAGGKDAGKAGGTDEDKSGGRGDGDKSADADSDRVGGARSRATDAQFLMQAAFGPTQDALDELSGKTYKDWITAQMGLPMESHRAFFRRRSNALVTQTEVSGPVRDRCLKGARFIPYAIRRKDKGAAIAVSGGKVTVAGKFRTDLKANSGWPASFQGKVCRASDGIGGAIELSSTGNCGRRDTTVSNPEVFLSTASMAAGSAGMNFVDGADGVKASARDAPNCQAAGKDHLQISGKMYFADDRQALVDNTLENPTPSNGDVCVNVPPNLFNEATCKVQPACANKWNRRLASGTVDLGVEFRKELFSSAQRHVYEVRGLLPSESPCNRTSHWAVCSDCQETASDLADVIAFGKALDDTTMGGLVEEVTVLCGAAVPAGAVVRTPGGRMYRHVHADEHAVFDFTAWVDEHPGGAEKIRQWATDNFTLTFPRSHAMNRWVEHAKSAKIVYLGNSFEPASVEVLPQDLQSVVARRLQSDTYVACGSSDEVMNEGRFGHRYTFSFRGNGNDPTRPTCRRDLASCVDSVEDHLVDNKGYDSKQEHEKGRVWLHMAVFANDQLRQRVAWALSQTFCASANGISGLVTLTENWLSFYDILVRNAFGNLFDILKELTYHPVTADFLTYFKSRSQDDANPMWGPPDENYAREIMQLFTIGTEMLNDDGTPMTRGNGREIPTYTNENIVDFARVFTGFLRSDYRGNSETNRAEKNYIDPLVMEAEGGIHDEWPKRNLYGGYIGDGYPICSEIPGQHFLSEGSIFIYQGTSASGSALTLRTSSPLYKFLCGGTGTCKYSYKKVLGEDYKCDGDECDQKAGALKLLKVGNGYYAYRKPPCVNFPWSLGSSPRAELAYDGRLMVHRDIFAKFSQFAVQWTTTPLTNRNCASPCRPSSMTILIGTPGLIGTKAPACSCPTTTKPTLIKSSAPSAADVKKDCPVGAWKPSTKAVRVGDVDVYHPSEKAVYDLATVFGVGGKFYKNLKYMVDVRGPQGRTGTFVSPPRFMTGDFVMSLRQTPGPRPAPAMAEVDALLEHLVEHDNAAPFLCYRLIQRLVTSNPSGDYVKSCVDAFRSGEAMGIKRSGRNGDIGAAVIATLLHPEARNPQEKYQGSFREPVVKLAHFLRATGYESTARKDGEVVRIQNLRDKIQQWPYAAPSVFSFFSPFYRPAGFNAFQKLPPNVVSPEFQIFSAPAAIHFLNGMLDTIDYGDITSCGVSAWGLTTTRPCKSGKWYFRLNESFAGSDADKAVDTLDVLLTGGRLSSENKATIKAQHTAATTGGKLTAALKATVMTPEFNTMGPSSLSGKRPPTPAPPPTTNEDYKATIMLYLAGGADSFNMLVPTNCPTWGEYRKSRTNMALGARDLMEISTTDQKCATFGMHKNMGKMHELYLAGEAAWFANIGPLVKPTTKYDFKAGNITLCKGMFSHQDQTAAASTLKCQAPGATAGGTGGRIAEALTANGLKTTAFSIAGVQAWPSGVETVATVMGNTPKLKDRESNDEVMRSLFSNNYTNVYGEEYAQQLSQHVETSTTFGELVAATTLVNSWPGKAGRVGNQLKEVAKLIKSRKGRGARRDLFFVELQGWDMHMDLRSRMEDSLSEVNQGVSLFVEEMKAQNMWDDVVLFTASEFGRPLVSNGYGTDHGWAGNHMIMGGKVNGGKVYNKFPESLAFGNEQDIGSGRLVPKYPWENMMVPIAQWMGVTQSQVYSVFPNLREFTQPGVIVQKDALFKP